MEGHPLIALASLRRGPALPHLVRIALFGLTLLSVTSAWAGSAGLKGIENEFETAIKTVGPATVTCLPKGIDARQVPGASSGVIVHHSGVVLSDGDAGVYVVKGADGKNEPRWADLLEVRLSDGKGFRSYEAKVLRRVREADTTMLQITNGPSKGFKSLDAGRSSDLRVGDFTFVMGNSFGVAAEAPPTLTAGVVSALIPLPPESDEARYGKGAGTYRVLYTSAAVNPGVNGGPVVDVEGRLVGTVSTFVRPDDPFQFLGKIMPIDRIRAVYADMPEAEHLALPKRAVRSRSRTAGALETVFRHTARRAGHGVLSLTVTRKDEQVLSRVAPGRGKLVQIPRFTGAHSAVLVDGRGLLVTSLYNLTNIATVMYPPWAPQAPENARVQHGLEAITGIVVHGPGGERREAKVISYLERANLALLEIEDGDVPPGWRPLSPAPEEALEDGRFVLALGNPLGADQLDDPLLTIGVLSKVHLETETNPWRSHWQTDAGVTDGNCGGAAVDLEGRLLGMLTIWSPLKHGRNSGIGFILPWSQIEPLIEPLAAGKRPGLLGVTWTWEPQVRAMKIDTVSEGGAAATAGLEPGDLVRGIDGQTFESPDAMAAYVRSLWSGDQLVLDVRRDAGSLEVQVTLGRRD